MSIDRLKRLQADNNEKGLEMMQEAGRFSRLASRHEDGTAPRAVSAFNLFQTPEHVGDMMVDKIRHKLGSGAWVREPSAGLGRLYYAVRRACKETSISLIEESADCCSELYTIIEKDLKTTLLQGDFLKREGLGLVDAVIMNPPFKMGRDIKHIIHALDDLKTGGLLVSLCYNGSRQNAKLKPLADSWEVLPAGTFKSEGTAAEVVLLTIRK